MDNYVDTGDHVRHDGHVYIVACVHGDYAYTCSNPSRNLLIAHCEVMRKATDDDRLALLRSMAAVQSRQHRPECARRRLEAMEVGVYESGAC